MITTTRIDIARIAALFACVLAGASASCVGNDVQNACTFTFTGNNAYTAGQPSCGTLAGSVLSFDAPTGGPTLHVDVDLGTAAAGTFTSETAATWSAVGTSATQTSCVYRAGHDAVPPGDFTLDLKSAGTDPHGQLTIHGVVQAPPALDCGPVDDETIAIAF